MVLKLGYIGLTLLMMILVVAIGFKTINTTFADNAVAKKKKMTLVIGLLLWQVYIYLVATSGVIATYELPPRFPLFLIMPAFLFTAIFIYKNRNNMWIQNIKPSTLIYIQVFRVVVETLFVFSISANVLPKLVTIEGYNFDMLIGFSAPIIAFLVFNKKKISKKVAILWNYVGLAVLASVVILFITSTFAPHLYDSEIPLISLKATKYPYVLIAGCLMPLAVFFHVLSIVQLRKN